jgi:hypothetical protein
MRELDRLGEDLVLLDREAAQAVLGNPAVERLITITGVNVTLAARLVAAIGDIRASPPRRSSSVILASIREFASQSLALRSTAASARWGAATPAPCLVEAAWATAKASSPASAWGFAARRRPRGFPNRDRKPLRWLIRGCARRALRRSGSRPPAPSAAARQNPTISRSRSASALFSGTVRSLIISSVIVGSRFG